LSPVRSPVTLLTGGTGFLGSHIGANLLNRGTEVVFPVRDKNNVSGAERLKKILDWHGIDSPKKENVRLAGWKPEDFPSGIDRIVYCMSDTSFSERNRQQVWTANVDQLKEYIHTAIRKKISRFVYISTAYAAGKRKGPCPEAPVDNPDFHNVYEESKAAAEHMLLKHCREAGIGLTIVRPSIVYGDSRTGRTLRFNALYYPVKTALFLARVYKDDIREKGGEKADEAGVSIDSEGRVRLPLRIETGEDPGVNLIPVDFFVRALFALMESDHREGIFHIVNPHQTRINDIIRFTQKQFDLSGIRGCGPEDFKKSPRNPLEHLYQRYLQAYLPYFRDHRIFLTSRSSPLLESRGITCPEFDEKTFRICMDYAEKNNWQSP